MASSPTTGRAKRAAIVQELQKKGVMALPPAWWGVPPAWIRDTPWWLRRTRFAAFLASLLDDGPGVVDEPARLGAGASATSSSASGLDTGGGGSLLACHQCLMADGTASAALASFCARRCEAAG